MTQRRKVEDYVKTIYLLRHKGRVRGADIAEQLHVKRPTVSCALKRMEQEGYLLRLKDHSVVLTPKGTVIAKEITDRNAGLFDLLIKLGISEAVAMKDACNMEHAISHESFSALIALAECRAQGELST